MHATMEKRLFLAFLVTILILVAEVVGGILSNSLALLSDAGHVLTDAVAIGLSMLAARVGRKPSDGKATFGYQRFGLLAALVNGLSLIGIAAFIFIESYQRFLHPPAVGLSVMLPVAIGGLIGNVVMALILGHSHENLNMKSAWLHVLGDTLSSIGVIIAGVVVYFTGWQYADPIAGVIIGIVIIWGGINVAREALAIFLEMTPQGFDPEAIAGKISALPGVLGIHDVHIWSPAHNNVAFSAHIWVHDQRLSDLEGTRKRIENMLGDMEIHHMMLQFECADCATNSLYCRANNITG
jgi:cobalt-zinc-cadmium efflux system protein